MIEVLSRTVKDGRVVSMIHKYLNAGVQMGDSFETSDKGVPQGGALSSLLNNIIVNELDKELESRGQKFVRYTDDLIILCRSKRSAERIMKSIIRFIEKKLFLKESKNRCRTTSVAKIKCLCYSFFEMEGERCLRVHPKSVLIKTKRADLAQQWLGQRPQEGKTPPVHRGFISLIRQKS